MGKKSERIEEKRNVPPGLRQLLELDVLLTDQFCKIVEHVAPRHWQSYYKYLEISCHGIPWIGGWLALIWLWGSPTKYQMQINFFIGLLLDIMVVALVKAITRRRRPRANQSNMFATVSVDKFSFPSGHATRACYIAHFFFYVHKVSIFIQIPLIIWSASVCVSRILLRRHHILDVAAGVFLGILESVCVGFIWLDSDTCAWLLSMVTDEKLEGGEYHV